MVIIRHREDPNSRRGPISIDPATRDIVQTISIRRVETVSDKLVNVEFDTIPNIEDLWKEMHPAPHLAHGMPRNQAAWAIARARFCGSIACQRCLA